VGQKSTLEKTCTAVAKGSRPGLCDGNPLGSTEARTLYQPENRSSAHTAAESRRPPQLFHLSPCKNFGARPTKHDATEPKGTNSLDDINFACTTCGQCCHDLRLPLTIAEANYWLKRGGQFELLCEAIPWPVEPRPGDAQAAYKRARSSAAMSGTLPVRVSIILTAAFAGACPNLRADMLCGRYDERPLVCRIYPAEINPFVPLVPKNKACPPEAWQTAAITTVRRPCRCDGLSTRPAIACHQPVRSAVADANLP